MDTFWLLMYVSLIVFYLQGLYYNFVWLLCYANLPPGVHTWETHCLRIKESLFVKNTAQPAKWLCAVQYKKNIHICTMMLKTDFAASYIFFIAYIFFRIPWSIERSKEQHFYEIEIFCNVLNFLICFTDYWIVGLSCFPQVG